MENLKGKEHEWINAPQNVGEGTIGDQKETGGLRAARNGKSVWLLALRTDGACRHSQNTEQNPTQRW